MGGGRMTPPPIDYVFRLSLQPHVVPVCYDYDPMQAGISSGPPFPDCWLTDEVVQDERRDDGGDRDAPREGQGAGFGRAAGYSRGRQEPRPTRGAL